MICIKWIRENPEKLDQHLHSRGAPAQSHTILAQDASYRITLQKLEDLYRQSNELAKSSIPLDQRRAEAKKIKLDTSVLTEQVHTLKEALYNTLLQLPNILDASVPIDPTGKGNHIMHTKGEIPEHDFSPKHHAEFTHLGFSDTLGVKLSGSRFSVLRGPLAVLENALKSFLLDHNMQRGYELISTPVLVSEGTLINTGQLPKFSHDLFKTQSNHWLIPTSEATLTSLVANQLIDGSELPYRFVGITECFRREAGAAGRHTRGLIRQHQFTKVELVHISSQEESLKELELLVQNSESILDALQLPYRRVQLCSGDTGFSAAKTFDLEVWMPGMGEYCEIASCSLCNDFQTRRMNAQYTSDNRKLFLHTLNGTGLAVGRTLAAIIENYQRQDGNLDIPEVLRPYMHRAILSPV